MKTHRYNTTRHHSVDWDSATHRFDAKGRNSVLVALMLACRRYVGIVFTYDQMLPLLDLISTDETKHLELHDGENDQSVTFWYTINSTGYTNIGFYPGPASGMSKWENYWLSVEELVPMHEPDAANLLVDALGEYKKSLIANGSTEAEAAERIVNKVRVLLNLQ